jgi:hypothetical protein
MTEFVIALSNTLDGIRIRGIWQIQVHKGADLSIKAKLKEPTFA